MRGETRLDGGIGTGELDHGLPVANVLDGGGERLAAELGDLDRGRLAGAEYVLGVRSESGGVAGDETFVGKKVFVPARAGAARVAGGVPAETGDFRVGVAGVGVDGDPAAVAFQAPALHRTGGQRRTEICP